MARKDQKDISLALVDKSSLHGRVYRQSVSNRARALQMNDMEKSKLKTLTRLIDKMAAHNENQQRLYMKQLSERISQIRAYQAVLDEGFHADQFETLRLGYCAKEARTTPRGNQRYVYETRVYHSGFSVKNLRPFVEKKLTELLPAQIQNETRHNQIEAWRTRLHPVIIDRKWSLVEILDEYKERKRKTEPQ